MFPLGFVVEERELDSPARRVGQALWTGVVDPDRETRHREEIEAPVAVVVGAREAGPACSMDEPSRLRLRQRRHEGPVVRQQGQGKRAVRAGREVHLPRAAQGRHQRRGTAQPVPILDDRDARQGPGPRRQRDARRDLEDARRRRPVEGLDAESVDGGEHELRAAPTGYPRHVDEAGLRGDASPHDAGVRGVEGGPTRHPEDPLGRVRRSALGRQHEQVAGRRAAFRDRQRPDLVDRARQRVRMDVEGRGFVAATDVRRQRHPDGGRRGGEPGAAAAVGSPGGRALREGRGHAARIDERAVTPRRNERRAHADGVNGRYTRLESFAPRPSGPWGRASNDSPR